VSPAGGASAVAAETRLGAKVHRLTNAAAAVSLVVGVAVLLGWILSVPVLKSVAPGLVSMKPNTAIGFMLAGTSLWLLRDEQTSPIRRAVGRSLGLVIAVFATLTLAEYIFDIGFSIDHLFSDPQLNGTPAGRPSPHTAVAFLLVGLWLTELDRRRSWGYMVRDVLSALACLVVLEAALGYMYGVKNLYGIPDVTGMAVHTVITFAVLCGGVLAARPRQSFMGLLTSSGTGGRMVRHLAPPVLLLPPAIAYAQLRAQEVGLIDTRDGIAILVGTIVVLLGGVVAYTGVSLNRVDAERRALEARLEDLADSDPLTAIFNRRGFDRVIERELATARRTRTPVAVLMIDIDGLKETNDSLGHRAGDELICGIAALLTSQLRVTDTVARLGGDEFAVVLPNTGRDGAETIAAKLVDVARRSSWYRDSQPVTTTISIGLAIAERPPPNARSLVAAADDALYAAKDLGGDRHATAPTDSHVSAEPSSSQVRHAA